MNLSCFCPALAVTWAYVQVGTRKTCGCVTCVMIYLWELTVCKLETWWLKHQEMVIQRDLMEIYLQTHVTLEHHYIFTIGESCDFQKGQIFQSSDLRRVILWGWVVEPGTCWCFETNLHHPRLCCRFCCIPMYQYVCAYYIILGYDRKTSTLQNNQKI